MIHFKHSKYKLIRVIIAPIFFLLLLSEILIDLSMAILKQLRTYIKMMTNTPGTTFVKNFVSAVESQGKSLDIIISCSEVDLTSNNFFKFTFIIEKKDLNKARSMLTHQQELRIIPQIADIKETANGFIVTVNHDNIN